MDKAVKNYLDAVPDSRRERLLSVRERILKLHPNVDESMEYKMPTYRLATGWISIGNQKNYVSVYTCGPHHLAAFREKHPKIKGGKGCLNFKDNDEIALDDLEGVINHALLESGH